MGLKAVWRPGNGAKSYVAANGEVYTLTLSFPLPRWVAPQSCRWREWRVWVLSWRGCTLLRRTRQWLPNWRYRCSQGWAVSTFGDCSSPPPRFNTQIWCDLFSPFLSRSLWLVSLPNHGTHPSRHRWTSSTWRTWKRGVTSTRLSARSARATPRRG